ncbi:hypothetical protein [Umezawaea beigongshangensis]|uniref:hypothetical protein n=1 Tax=Umezawaea beigongshangensis TaxID=2780383 RepID=UPI0018F16194|nr:hypothetical protein [Umezawaea beigongshangensis]
MTTSEAATTSELIADCAQLPTSITTAHPPLPEPAGAATWSVDERCSRQVEGLSDYGS